MGSGHPRATQVARAALTVFTAQLLAAGLPSVARAGLCLRFTDNTIYSCNSVVLLDCPGPGCPSGAIYTLNVSFGPDSEAQVSRFALPDDACERLGVALKGVDKLVVVGHAESIANVDQARRRSLEVAEAVRDRLVTSCTIDASRVLSVGVGRDEPIPDPLISDSVSIVADPVLLERIQELREMMF